MVCKTQPRAADTALLRYKGSTFTSEQNQSDSPPLTNPIHTADVAATNFGSDLDFPAKRKRGNIQRPSSNHAQHRTVLCGMYSHNYCKTAEKLHNYARAGVPSPAQELGNPGLPEPALLTHRLQVAPVHQERDSV